ncbi:hypothetical protein [Neobacillus sp. FSL H8-0543]|uniref:hypothetical protein n=1 Tax=Neobacillus sp. FSL H8-0543 TaxID=2954672 RepID=UPI00315883D5
MNQKLKILIKVTPFLSVLFILTGITMAILAVFDHNVMTLTVSLVLISQAVLSLIYTKLFKKIW